MLVERHGLIETAVEQDDDIMERYLEGEEPTPEEIKKCIRSGTLTMDFFPTYCGSAFKDKGVQLVLDAAVDYLPDPTEVKPQPEVDLEGNETGEFAIVDPDRPLRALAFKIMDDRFGALTFIRIYSGRMDKGMTVLNTFTGKYRPVILYVMRRILQLWNRWCSLIRLSRSRFRQTIKVRLRSWVSHWVR